MTNEQIKQNAETAYPGFEDLQIVYIEGAHSRDEEIEQLGKDYHDMFLTLANKIEQLRKPWTNVVERLPEEGQDILISHWNENVTRINCVSTGDINYMKEHPDLIKYWMLTPKVKRNESE